MAASERSQPASLSPGADLRSWLGGVRGGFFGSQLRLSKAETLLHFRLAEFQVPLDTESRSYNRPQLSIDLSTVSWGSYITTLPVKFRSLKFGDYFFSVGCSEELSTEATSCHLRL